MMAARRGFATLVFTALAGVLLAPGALASPLGLAVGDQVSVIEVDALYVDGNGGAYTWNGADGAVTGDGDVTSIALSAGPSLPGPLIQTDVTFHFDGDFDFQTVIPQGGSKYFIQANFVTPTPGPAFSMSQTGLGTILEGDFNIPLTLSGTVNLAETSFTLTTATNIQTTGGHAQLIDALGGIGGIAVLSLTTSAFNFLPGLNIISADGNFFNDNVTFAMTGTITPATSSPFVPEPSTAIMLAAGLLGLVAAGRRAR